MISENEIISEYLAPLADKPESLSLTDDAAIIKPARGTGVVLSVDTVVAGIHFLEDDPVRSIAKKAVRVNLSDMASMGAKPKGVLLSLAMPAGVTKKWIEEFTAGLAEDLEKYEIALLGGDIVKTTGPLTITVTITGEVPKDKELKRSGAKPDDIVFVSGTIGDAALGLMVLNGEIEKLPDNYSRYLQERYHIPRPRVKLGQALRDNATACMDISDGLCADMEKICKASGVSVQLDLAEIPLSPAVRAVVSEYPEVLEGIISKGDDYELLFTAPKSAMKNIMQASQDLGLQITSIGHVTDLNTDVTVYGANGMPIPITETGYQHF